MAQAQRSPILGYNHNIGYRGLVFHVQTEDSGINNPHVFTHLFYGGVILISRKLEYDVAASEDVVKSLMQAQHKSVMKGLKHGEFDDKIDAYLVNTPGLLPRGASPVKDADKPDVSLAEVVPPPVAAVERPPVAAQVEEPERVVPIPSPVGLRPRRHTRPGTTGRTPILPAPPPVADPRAPQRAANSSVLVSAPPIVVDSSRDARQPSRTVREAEARDSIFDQSLITEKSLDEVILAYLSEDSED